MLMGVRWEVASPLRTRHVEDLMEERGVERDHATIIEFCESKRKLLSYTA